MDKLERDEFDQATARAAWRQKTEPMAVAARYDRTRDRVVVRFNTGLELAFAPGDAQGLQGARPDQLDEIEITPSGFGLHFPRLDADVYVPALLKGSPGSRVRIDGHGVVEERGARRPVTAAAARIDARPGRKKGAR